MLDWYHLENVCEWGKSVKEYKLNRIKKSRICGSEYTNYKGNIKQAIKTETPCS